VPADPARLRHNSRANSHALYGALTFPRPNRPGPDGLARRRRALEAVEKAQLSQAKRALNGGYVAAAWLTLYRIYRDPLFFPTSIKARTADKTVRAEPTP
jgi:hypothetical protein